MSRKTGLNRAIKNQPPVDPSKVEPGYGYSLPVPLREDECYYYHSDHLGSTSYVTDSEGVATQFVCYIPFGEAFVDEHTTRPSMPYKFNGKEQDEQTGLLYYGARYYEPKECRFYGVDPLAEKYPNMGGYVYCANNPVRYVDLNGMEPTPEEAARMAAHVYGDKRNGILTGGWQISSRDFGLTKKDLDNTSTGLKSQVYQRMKSDGKIEYTYATAGTEASWKDVIADLNQPLGLSKQYEKAADNAKAISKVLGGTELTFTGHSLGGGEAALNSLITDRKAITFNAAGVGDITKFSEGNWKTPFKSESKIDAYILSSDPLNTLQNKSSIMPDVNGNRYYLSPKDLPSQYNGHSMDNVLKNFGVNNPIEYKK